MPTVGVLERSLFQALGRSFTREEFDDLCFDYGIELDDVTTEKEIIRKEKHLDGEEDEGEEKIYKIEVPANRYDLLCIEGISRALRIFLEKEEVPNFRLAEMSDTKIQRMIVKPDTSKVRPYIVCAILRGVNFDQERFNSFIDLQDKLHQNLCRKRTLVAIGTHDLDTLEGPFTYEALPPSKIKFIPLKQTKEFTADGLLKFYEESDLKLSKFVHIIKGSPVYPVIYDNRRTVLSLPPIINGAHSAITLNTKNVFIECTATDMTKAKIVLNTMVTMFSEYCENKFVIEPVQVICSDGTSAKFPDLTVRSVEIDLPYINRCIGLSLNAKQVAGLLKKMQLVTSTVGEKLHISIPPTRSDILHPCDVMEDVAIAYGFNNIGRTIPCTVTQGREQALNSFSDSLRLEIALAGFTEVLTWVLSSHKENFSMLRRTDNGKTTVVVSDPRGSDFEVVRTSLLPGILKTMGHNKNYARPLKLFELSDVVLLDDGKDVGARNERHIAALYCSATSGFEIIHGLLDRIMEMVGAARPAKRDSKEVIKDYYLKNSQVPEFLEGCQAEVFYRDVILGKFGIVHPEVLENFDIPDPCSVLELNIEPLLCLSTNSQ